MKKLISRIEAIEFYIEIYSTDNSVKLINGYNSLIYKPKLTSISALSLIIKKEGVKSFEVKDVFELNFPKVIINKTNEIEFERIMTRIDIQNEIENQNSNYLNSNMLVSKLEELKLYIRTITDNSSKVVSDSNKKISDFIINYNKSIISLEEEINFIKKAYNLSLNDKNFFINNNGNNDEISDASKSFSELDVKYGHLKSRVYYCKGKINGCCRNEELYGSNPYTQEINNEVHCDSAYHSDIINENGGFYEVRFIGKYDAFLGSSRNGLISNNYTSYNAISIHLCRIKDIKIPENNNCGFICENNKKLEF